MPASANTSMPAAVASGQPGRVLVRGVNWLGDAVMTTPALQRLRERLPGTHITLLTPRKLADLWLGHPSIDEVMTLAAGQGVWSVAGQIRRAVPFDLALVLPNSPRSALEAWLGRVPQRVGYARPWRSWFLTRAIAPRPDRVVMRVRSVREVRRLCGAQPQPAAPPAAHQIHEYLHLAAALGACPEPLSPMAQVAAAEVEEAGRAFLADLPRKTSGAAARPPVILGLNPGAEFGPAKRWPAQRFGAVAREVCRRLPSCVWLVFGGTEDWELCQEIARAAPANALDLAGRTSLRQLMGLLKLCRVLLTNDTGPMHLAAALGTPVVVPFGSTSAELTGPGLPGEPRQPHRLLSSRPGCAPCFRRACPIDFRCMTGLGVEAVTEAVLGVV
ncbi:MAG: lipopolysaccharide heptosyltransferase II [Verrucomicrobiota bacterium]|jgi:heptosyltransferase-2